MITLLVKCHDGEEYTTEVEKYDAVATMKQLNDETQAMVVIGDVIVHRTNVSRVVKVK